MDTAIAAMLAEDGIVNGAVYALMAISIILVFSVTRILFIPQGEFIVFGAATLAQLQAKVVPSVVWLVLIGVACALVQEVWTGLRERRSAMAILKSGARLAALPTAIALVVAWLSGQNLSMAVQVVASIALVMPLGSLLHRLVYGSMTDATVLMLLIVSVGVHFGLTSLALAFLGPEGFRTPPFAEGRYEWGAVSLNAQALAVLVSTGALIGVLFVLFTKTFRGLGLRAAAVNQLGAQLVGLSARKAGQLSLSLAAGLGALSGVLIAPNTTIFYDTGFLIGLKGFVAAVFAGLASFPGALIGALAVGLVESFGAFWASAFKEMIVFTAVLPILLWRSFLHGSAEEH